MRSYAKPFVSQTRVEHKFLTNCEIVTSVGFQYNMMTIGYFLIIAGWYILVKKLFREECSTLQRGLMILPILKFIYTYMYGSYVSSCPWPDQMEARYKLMIVVTVSTLYQTMIVAFLMLLSKGWKIVRDRLPRGEVSKFTMILGTVYITFSAYFVAVNFSEMKLIIGVSIVKVNSSRPCLL